MTRTGQCSIKFLRFLELIKDLVTRNLAVSFSSGDVVVVGVKPFLLEETRTSPFFPLVTTSQSEVALEGLTKSSFGGFRYHVEAASGSCHSEKSTMGFSVMPFFDNVQCLH